MFEDNGLIHNISRVSKSIDNGTIEGFLGDFDCLYIYLDAFDPSEFLDQKIKEHIGFLIMNE